MKIPLRYKDKRCEGDCTLRQVQLVGLHLLHVFDAICSEHNLSYFLDGGTLLGAFRHGGFIPWDDDVDVGMPRKDYERFLKIARQALPDDVTLQTPSDVPTLARTYSKLRDDYSFMFEHCAMLGTAHSGIWIDVFPWDEAPNVREGLRIWMARKRAAALGHMKVHLNSGTKGVLAAFLHVPFAFVYRIAHLLLMCLWWGLCRITGSRSLCITPEFWETQDHYQKEWIFPLKRHRFEDGEFLVPAESERCLQQVFGDWMSLPPPEKRKAHCLFADPVRAVSMEYGKHYSTEVEGWS